MPETPDRIAAPAAGGSPASDPGAAHPSGRTPTGADLRRWRRYLADEHAEAQIYRDLARRRTGEEREILLAIAEAEGRHAEHWERLLGPGARPAPRTLRSRTLGWFARRFGSVFTLALVQRAESRSDYEADDDATAAMAADERIHEEIVRSLATRGRTSMSGNFRAAVFGANDGLVSNLALILGIGASGASASTVLLTGIAGLLAGALSMGAGEFVSVRSQRELAEASKPSPHARRVLPHLDVDRNELALVYRARGMDPQAADERARRTLALVARADREEGAHEADAVAPSGVEVAPAGEAPYAAAHATAHAAAHAARPGQPTDADHDAAAHPEPEADAHELLGSAWGAASSSFCFFATGALLPVLPYIVGLEGLTAVVASAVIVGLALLGTGATVGVLSGAAPGRRALRQIAIGYGAAAATYLLGLAFGTTLA